MKQIEQTRHWLHEVVIKLNLCPFIHPFVENNLIDISSCSYPHLKTKLPQLLEKERLKADQTTLLVLKDLPERDFAWFYELTQDLQEDVEELYPSTFHLIAFHPSFCFQGLSLDDKANYVNRSPLPTIHILKRAHIDQIKLASDHGEKISRINEEKLKSLDQNEFDRLFSYLRKDS